MARGSLAKGLLANKSVSNYLDWSTKDIDLIRHKMISFSTEKITTSQLSIQWVLSNKLVSSVVVGLKYLTIRGRFRDQLLTRNE